MTAAYGREVDPGRVERVARAISDVDSDLIPLEACSPETREIYRRYAVAALAADTGEAQQAVERVRALADELDAEANRSPSRIREAVLADVAVDIRAALASDGTGHIDNQGESNAR